jgi:hypothetical protein
MGLVQDSPSWSTTGEIKVDDLEPPEGVDDDLEMQGGGVQAKQLVTNIEGLNSSLANLGLDRMIAVATTKDGGMGVVEMEGRSYGYIECIGNV